MCIVWPQSYRTIVTSRIGNIVLKISNLPGGGHGGMFPLFSSISMCACLHTSMEGELKYIA